ncbi:stromal interaction molecule 2 [Hoplias malabaricus]|uniref:stromal interaction molecule 2 n=1 Tax=Hoplias malabaricus TaxID=27720 RepID=UPI003461B99A
MLLFCVVVVLGLFGPVRCDFSTDEYAVIKKEPSQATLDTCLQVSPPCVTEADHFSLEALRHIHQEMDDDQDGGIEVEESVEFIIEDMQQQQQTNKHSKLHQEDQHITVEELWRGWKSSEVHNWTQEDVLHWLHEFVELPQYEKNFKELRINGNTLPRIASNEPSFMSNFLKIQDQQHKHKLKLKALDVVLFGPPTRPPHNWVKDLLLIISVVMGVGGCLFAQAQNKASKIHIAKMMKDLESLQIAEQSLRDLQEQLEQAQEEKRTVAVEKQFLEEKMRDEIQGAQEEASRLQELRQGAVSELSRLRYAEEELEQVRGALKKAEMDMQVSWSVPESLQLWLQFTHEVEVQYYNVKKQSAEQQLSTAKDEAEKIKKKRSSILGTLHVVHSSSLDQVDHKILEAKNALAEVTACLQERLHRWQQIEWLCGFPVMKNGGLASLTATLYPDPNWMLLPRAAMSSYQIPAGVDDMEESLPTVMPQIPVTVTPIKLSPRALVRSRRTSHIVQQPMILSPDPDLLIPIRAPIPRYGEEEGERIIFPTLMKQECLETPSDSEPIGSTIGRIYTGPELETPPRRLYRKDRFSSSITRKVSFEEQEASPSRKLSREELGESLWASPRKVFQDDLNAETPVRKSSREDPDSAMETVASPVDIDGLDSRKIQKSFPIDTPNFSLRQFNWDKTESSLEAYTGMRLKDELDISVVNQKRLLFKERKNLSGDSLSRMTPGEEIGGSIQCGNAGLDLEAEMDLISKLLLSEDTQTGMLSKDMSLERAARKLSRDELDVSTSVQMKEVLDNNELPKEEISGKVLQDELDLSMNSERGMLFTGASMDSITRNKMHGNMEMPIENRCGMSLRERRGETTLRKLSREDLDVTVDRRRLYWDLRLDTPPDKTKDKIQREIFDLPMESGRCKISREEFVDSGNSALSQPDLTALMIRAPPQEPLSRLVYDGILEKSYPLNAPTPGDLSHASSMPSVSSTLQSFLGIECSGSKSTHSENASPPESGSGEKSKKTSKLKRLFKKKKHKEKETDKDPPGDCSQGGLQKL